MLGVLLNEDTAGLTEDADNDNGKPVHITGRNIRLVSITGGIGEEDNYIAIDSDGKMVLLAAADIYAEETAGDMVVELVKTEGNIHLLSEGSIVAAEDAEGIIITGEDITLTSASGGIGSAEKFVTIDLGNRGIEGIC